MAAANVVPLHREQDRPVCDPSTGEVIEPRHIQHHLDHLSEQVSALTAALAKAHRLNESQKTQIANLREERAEAACEDPDEVRALVRWHYSRFGRKKRTVPLSGMDAQIVTWLLQRCDWDARMVALASVGFAENAWYREKGMVAMLNLATTKVDGKRVKDEEKAFRFYIAGARLKGEQPRAS